MPFVTHPPQLLTVEEMARADRLAVDDGISSIALMENAGHAVTREIMNRWQMRPVLVLCGPGNNGGDGFVVARLLRQRGWPVDLALVGSFDRLKGDAAAVARRIGPRPMSVRLASLRSVLDQRPLVVDALFGAGLARPVQGATATVIDSITERGLDVVAIDTPSGVDGNTGAIRGTAPKATLTVTFFRKKPGHLLLPGRSRCGEIVLADIGIPDGVLNQIRPRVFENSPLTWGRLFPWPSEEDHKYRRGHAVISGGGHMTGAARLAARAAQRIGAGLVTVAVPQEAFAIYANSLASALVDPAGDADAFAQVIADSRRNAVLVGPGSGVNDDTRERVIRTLETRKACVLDADALTAFADKPEALFDALHGQCLLTPHPGEYARLFGACDAGDRLSQARQAAALCGANVLVKGADTVIAAPDGRTAAINTNAPPSLAIAGAGDVLAGLVLGLLAQGVDAYFAGCMAAWVHGAAAAAFGSGLIAEDIPENVPSVLQALKTWEASNDKRNQPPEENEISGK